MIFAYWDYGKRRYPICPRRGAGNHRAAARGLVMIGEVLKRLSNYLSDDHWACPRALSDRLRAAPHLSRRGTLGGTPIERRIDETCSIAPRSHINP